MAIYVRCWPAGEDTRRGTSVRGEIRHLSELLRSTLTRPFVRGVTRDAVFRREPDGYWPIAGVGMSSRDVSCRLRSGAGLRAASSVIAPGAADLPCSAVRSCVTLPRSRGRFRAIPSQWL